ncbi:transposase [Halococcus sp. AFM35]|uniref:transposase n=1 Tax=Halococcus sp. AFM35 TaxID=3421653 RepID=UPI003EBD5843
MLKTERYAEEVRAFLRTNRGFSTKPALRDGTTIPDWYLRKMTADGGEFYTSLNQNNQYIASKYTVGHRADTDGFWRPEVEDEADGTEEVVFHKQGTTKKTLKYLAFNRPSGLTAAEACDLLSRPCYRALAQLADTNDIAAIELGDTTLYVHTWAHKRDRQLTERRTNTSVEIDLPGESPADRHLFAEEILTEFTTIADEHIDSIASDRAAALLLRQLHDDSFETTETRVRHSHRLKGTLGYDEPSDVPDGTSIWRSFDVIPPTELEDCLQAMTTELVEEEDQAGRYAVVDATHMHAWANTRQEIENGDIEGASWGVHEGQFYGYKAYLVIDAAIELPVAALLTTGKRNDQRMFVPLIEKYDDLYDTADLEAVFADAGFDSTSNREKCQEILDTPLMTAINPRRSSPLKALKDEIKSLFEDHSEEIETVHDALELLPQTLLSDYGVETDNDEHNYIIHAIKERMNRHLRAGVERVISRLKSFAGLERPRARKEKNVRTHMLLSVVSLVAVALTAKRCGKPSLMLSPSRII